MGKCLFLRKGETHTAPISGILANTLAVGSSVYLMENGAAAEYLVVHQGLPSSLYDASCDGTWLLRKDLYESRSWHSFNSNSYKASTIHSYLNSTFFNLFGTIEQSVIKNVKIPYVNGTGSGGYVESGTSGLSANIFLLSPREVGSYSGTYAPEDGAKLDYFEEGDTTGSTANMKRIAYYEETAKGWWLRSPDNSNTSNVWLVESNGASGENGATVAYFIRPALILPHNALFDKNTLILKGVA